jgi:hypothetical protein
MSMSSDRISSPSETRSSCADARTSSHSRSWRDLCPKKCIAHQPYPSPGWDPSTADRPNRPRQPTGSSPNRGQACRTRRERRPAAEHVTGPAALRFHYDSPAGLLRLACDQDRRDPAVSAGGVRSVSPTASSATSAGARSSGRAATTRPRSYGGCAARCGHRESRERRGRQMPAPTRRQGSRPGDPRPRIRQSQDARLRRRSVADATELVVALCHEVGCDVTPYSAVTNVVADRLTPNGQQALRRCRSHSRGRHQPEPADLSPTDDLRH